MDSEFWIFINRTFSFQIEIGIFKMKKDSIKKTLDKNQAFYYKELNVIYFLTSFTTALKASG